MSTSYFVLWIPQIKKEKPHVIRVDLPKKKLQDIKHIQPLFVQGKISLETYDIILKYSIGNEIPDKKLIFNYIESDERGFVIYKLELDDQQDDFLCRTLRTEMPNAIYHYFKSFYHRHMFHDESEDSLLRPFFSLEPIKWNDSKIRNNVVERLIEDYETKFGGASDLYELFRNRIETSLESYRNIWRMQVLLQRLYQQVRDTLSERLYCEFLLRSFPKSTDSVRKSELKSTINNLEIMVFQMETSINKRFSLAGLEYSVNGFIVGVIGVIIGLGSMVFSLMDSQYQSRKSTKELNENKETLKENIRLEADSLRKNEQVIFKEVQLINDKVDTINHNIRKIQRTNKR
ncbi:MAG: hypothetical protein IKO26_04345 [Paludibacteraceae bacterium]|nr:hypothetical protein [Paludibacteraceae bacterium]